MNKNILEYFESAFREVVGTQITHIQLQQIIAQAKMMFADKQENIKPKEVKLK